MLPDRQPVELRPAAAWDCPNCERENFVRAAVREYDAATERRLREACGALDQDGHFLVLPDHVRCAACGAAYDTIPYEE